MRLHIFKLILVSLFIFVLIGCCDKEEQKPETRLKLINVKLTREEYAFAVSKNNSALKDDLNNYINILKKSGNFDSIVAIYMEKGENESLKTGVKYTTEAVTKTDKNLIIATNCPFEPFEYIDKENNLIYGIDIEIANAFAKYKGLELIVRNIDFDDILVEVANGKADIGMAGITVTEERKKICDFTESYFKSSQRLVVDGKNTDFDKCKTLEDVNKVIKSLSNETIGYQIGTTGNWYVSGDGTEDNPGFVNIKPKGFKTTNEAINDLLLGKIYATVLDEEPANNLVEEVNIKDLQQKLNDNDNGTLK